MLDSNQSRLSSGTRQTQEARKKRKSRLFFILGGILLLSIAGIFAREVVKALYVRSVTGSVFNTYVIDHKIGQATISDDASGFQTDFCVLHLNQPIPEKQLPQQTFALMQKYHQLDGGSSLTIVYTQSSTGRQVTESTAEFLPAQSVVLMTINLGSTRESISKRVTWNRNG